MSRRRNRARAFFLRGQRGQALILTVVLIALGIVGLVFAMASSLSVSISNKQTKDVDALFAQVRLALVGWSASRVPTSPATFTVTPPNARPGELPCPDTSAPGTATYGFEDGSCAPGAVGRVPWKTLRIPEPKDSAGETLWYTVSSRFRIWTLNANEINSNTRGNLTVRAGTSAVTLTTEAIAILFAPGAALGAQVRDDTNAYCPTTNSTIARNRCAANYLDSTGGVDNAALNPTTFIQAPGANSFNDRLLVITTSDLMPVLERRVAGELLTLLETYRSFAGYYPWADISNGYANVGYNQGRVPLLSADAGGLTILGIPIFPGAPDWSDVITTLPVWRSYLWLRYNNWWKPIRYAVAMNSTQSPPYCAGILSVLSVLYGTNQCDSSRPTLIVDGSSGYNLVLLTPGPQAASTNRDENDPWSDYFELSENSDANDDRYATPTGAPSRDRIFTVP